jgi:hypothetical protein
MTICPQNNGYNEQNLKRHGIASKKNYNDARKHNVTWSSNDTSVSKQELFKNVTYEFDEMVKQI